MKAILLFAMSVTTWLPISAQQAPVKISGQVIDAELNEPVIGASVRVKDTQRSVFTDIDGRFAIEAPPGSTLVVSYVGYDTQEIPLKTGVTAYHILLREGIKTFEEVVIVAYGSQNKGLVTSAISSIAGEELIKLPTASITNNMAGVVPGLTALQTSGQPGKDAAILYVRGMGSLNDNLSQPLILVDGVEREFSQIDPNEVESISVLKDASSTAVFGVRGANGVILVTTRNGKTGKPTISVSSSLDVQQPITLLDVCGSYEWARFWNIRQAMDGVTNTRNYFTPEQIEAYRIGSDPIMYPNTNWTKLLLRDTYLQNRNNVNISGGNDRVRYFVSVSYLYQNGVLKGDYPGQAYDNNYRYDRYNYRTNLDINLTRTTTLKFGIGGYTGIIKQPYNYNDGTGEASDPWTFLQLRTTPFSSPGFVNGVRTRVTSTILPLDSMWDGFVAFYNLGYTQTYNTNLNSNADLTQRLDFITKGLSVSFKGAYDNLFKLVKDRAADGNNESQTVYYKSTRDSGGTMSPTSPYFDKTHVFIPSGIASPLIYGETQTGDQKWYLEGRVNYERTFGEHRVSGLLLYNQSRDYYPDTYAYIPRSYIGWVGRATYSYAGKYLFDANMGYNGSENFAPGKTRFGWFPAMSAGWVITGEKFMERQKVVDYLKLRASWGRVGNDKGVTTRFMYMPAVWGGSGSYSFGASNPSATPGTAISREGNRDVTWETADKTNFGIETKWLDSRLSINFDYFTEKRTGILISPNSMPSIMALSLPTMNLGKVDNSGYELVMRWEDKVGSDFRYHVNANVSYARNKIVFMDEVPNTWSYMDQTGKPTGTVLLYKFVRLYQYSDFTQDASGNYILNPTLPQPYMQVYPGDAMYADLNEDNIVDDNDRYRDGYSTRPEYTFGLNLGATWKGFSLTMNWLGAAHVNSLFEIQYRIPFTNDLNTGLLKYHYDGDWTPENQLTAVYPRPATVSRTWNTANSTLWLQNTSYLRLKSLNLGYTFSGNGWWSRFGAQSLNVTLSGYNLLTFTGSKYLDPENQNTNNGAYPLSRIYSIGINVNF